MKLPWKKKKTASGPGTYRFLRELYIGDSIRGRERRLRKKLEAGEDPGEVIFLILSTSDANQLDLIAGQELLKPYYREREIFVVGIASGNEDAKLVLLRMMQQCVNRTGSADLRFWLEQQFRKEAMET